MKSDFNLPPGVTVRDVSGPEMVECPDCDGVGYGYRIPVWAGAIIEKVKCPTCGGTGEVRKERTND